MAAVSVVIMLASYFPYLTYAIPGVAGVFVMVVAMELGAKWGYLCYVVSALIVLFAGEMEAKLLYLLFLGYYPVLKGNLERIKNKSVQYLLKLAVFNVAAFVFYKLSVLLLSVDPSEYNLGFKYGLIAFAVVANIVFCVYDFALSRIVTLYFVKYHDRINKMLK